MLDTTTIRVPSHTRDQLRALAWHRGESAGEVVAKLVDDADEEAILEQMAIEFERLAADPRALAEYRDESRRIGLGFDAEMPEW